MLPYYALIFIPLLFAFFYELFYERFGNKGKKKNYTIIIFFIIYCILLAFRSANIGADVLRYFEHYNIVKSYSFSQVIRVYQNSDLGYFIFTKLLAIVFSHRQWLLIIVALFTTIPMATMYYRESENSLVSIALFMVMPIFQMNFSGLRQAMAISFIVPAMYAVRDRNLKRFLIIVAFACLFHSSAIIILLMYPIYHWKIKRKHLIFIFPLIAFVYTFNSEIYMFVFRFIDEKFQERYAYTTQTGAYTMLLVFFVFVIYAFVFTNEKKYTHDEKGLRNYLLMALLLQIFALVNSVAMRLNYYYLPFIPIIITQATNRMKIQSKILKICISMSIYVLFICYYLNKSRTIDSLGIYPYEFFL